MDTRHNILVMAIVGIFLLGTAAWAAEEDASGQPWQGGPRWQNGGGRPGRPFAMGPGLGRGRVPNRPAGVMAQPDVLERLANRLDLTDEQRQKLQQIREDLGRFCWRLQSTQTGDRPQWGRNTRPGQGLGRGRGRGMQGTAPCWCPLCGPGSYQGKGGPGGPWMGGRPAQGVGRGPRGGQFQDESRGPWMRRAMGRGPGRPLGQEPVAGRQGTPGVPGARRPGRFALDRLFERADSNNDGLLSREEIEAFDKSRRTEPVPPTE